MRRLIIAGLCALLFAPIASACGPTRQKHVTSLEINAPANAVWAVVGNYADFNWTGRVVKIEATGGLVPEVARRQLIFRSGAVFADALSAYEPENKLIAFMTETEDVKELPVRNYASRIVVRELDGHTIVEWRGAFVRGYPNNDPPPELSDEAALAAVKAFQEQALKNLKKLIEEKSLSFRLGRFRRPSTSHSRR